MDALPDPVVERVGNLLVVRDDKLLGGTKVRYMLPLLQDARESAFVYASPAYGYAQIALAVVARELGKRAVIFTAERRSLHPRTLEAQALGAVIHQVPRGYLSNVQAKAAAHALEHGAMLVPFGVDVPEALGVFAEAARAIGVVPTEVWAAAGSGALIRGLQGAWPGARFNAVQVGAEPDAGAATVWHAPETFDQPARYPPPFPSCSNYDAKVWQFARRAATPGALIWNVAA